MRKDEMRQGRGAANAVIVITILLLAGQALGVTKTLFDITILGYEIQLLWVIIGVVIVFLYGEVTEARRKIVKLKDEIRAEITQNTIRVAGQIEETIAEVEAKLKARIAALT